MKERLEELVEWILGVGVFSKCGNVEESFLAEWLDSENLLELINSILETLNETTKELRRGKVIRTTIESSDGNLLIFLVGEEVLVVITEKEVSLKFLKGVHEKKSLEFKIEKKI